MRERIGRLMEWCEDLAETLEASRRAEEPKPRKKGAAKHVLKDLLREILEEDESEES